MNDTVVTEKDNGNYLDKLFNGQQGGEDKDDKLSSSSSDISSSSSSDELFDSPDHRESYKSKFLKIMSATSSDVKFKAPIMKFNSESSEHGNDYQKSDNLDPAKISDYFFTMDNSDFSETSKTDETGLTIEHFSNQTANSKKKGKKTKSKSKKNERRIYRYRH